MDRPRIPCVGAIITGPGGRLLLIKRGHEPEAGRWSLPGGRIEPGETDQQALVREVREETGLEVAPGRLVGEVERPWADGRGGGVRASTARVLVIRDYAAAVTGGDLAAGDDAADARWAGPADLEGLPLTTGLAEVLYAWGVLPLVPSPALIAEATRRAGVVWLTVPPNRTGYPVWHIWRAEAAAAYLVTGPGEQPAPGLAAAARITVTVPSKDSGGTLVTWTAGVRRVDPGSAEWDAVIGPLVAGRLNAVVGPPGDPLAARWARSCAVFCLTPMSP